MVRRPLNTHHYATSSSSYRIRLRAIGPANGAPKTYLIAARAPALFESLHSEAGRADIVELRPYVRDPDDIPAGPERGPGVPPYHLIELNQPEGSMLPDNTFDSWLSQERGLVQALWPHPARIEQTSCGSQGYIAVPSFARMKLLVPADQTNAVASLRFGVGGTGTVASMQRWALKLALASAPCLLRHRLAIRPSELSQGLETLETHLAELLHQQISLTIRLGPPRANRKPVLQVLGEDLQPLAFVKVGLDILTKRLVNAERLALHALAQTSVPDVLIPRVLAYSHWNGLCILALTPLPTWRAHSRVPSKLRYRAMHAVAQCKGVYAAELSGSTYADRLLASSARHGSRTVQAVTRAIIDKLNQGSTELLFGTWHGDWTVHNEARLGNRLLLWDWERLQSDVPIGFDALHSALRRMVRGTPHPRTAQRLLDRSPQILAHTAARNSEPRSIALLYLAEIANRYTADNQRASGGRSGRVERWLLPVLQSLI